MIRGRSGKWPVNCGSLAVTCLMPTARSPGVSSTMRSTRKRTGIDAGGSASGQPPRAAAIRVLVGVSVIIGLVLAWLLQVPTNATADLSSRFVLARVQERVVVDDPAMEWEVSFTPRTSNSASARRERAETTSRVSPHDQLGEQAVV